MDARIALALRTWEEADLARGLHPLDHAAVRATASPRVMILELALDGGRDARDLYTACATLGRLLFEAGASPSLASAAPDGAGRALARIDAPLDDARLGAARASVAEGYVSALVASEREAARRAWDWPACAVVLDDETCAIAAGHPAGDDDALGAWASRVATKAARAGVKRAIVTGAPAARRELASSLGLAGVEVLERLPKAAARLRLPWRR